MFTLHNMLVPTKFGAGNKANTLMIKTALIYTVNRWKVINSLSRMKTQFTMGEHNKMMRLQLISGN